VLIFLALRNNYIANVRIRNHTIFLSRLLFILHPNIRVKICHICSTIH